MLSNNKEMYHPTPSECEVWGWG